MLNNAKHTNFIHSIFESLEERVLFDGVPDATFVLPQADVATPIPEQVQSLEQIDSQAPRELILIDAGVENSEQLLQGILESKPNSAIEIRMIDSNSDGIEQISAILAESDSKYDAIHIISHGSEGEIALGNSSLSADNLNQYADELAGWSNALSEDADLLFYGCDLAGNEGGTEFIESISAITGADVAASDDLTGSAELGGDWDLELEVGTVETAALSATAFDGILADTDGDGEDDADDLDDDNDGISDVIESSAGLVFDSNGVIITSRTFDVAGTTVINPASTASFITGDNIYTAFDQGTFGTAVVPPDDGNPNTSETVSPAINPYPGFVVDQNGNSLDGAYDEYADLGFGEWSIVANIDEAGARNGSQAFPVIDPVYGREGRFFTTDPDANAIPTLSDTITNLVPGQLYEYSFWAANSETFGDPNSIGVQIGQPGDTLGEVLNTGGLPPGSSEIPTDGPSTNGVVWTRFSFVFLADSSGQLQIDLASTGNATAGNDLLIDNIELRTASVDTDGDGAHNSVDLDSDNDGISDLVESGADALVVDTDRDGVYDNTTGVGAEVDATGIPTAANGGVAPADTDTDGVFDFLDLDSDGDGIPDTVEAFPTANITNSNNDVSDDDSDGDGIIDAFDSTIGHGGDFTTPENTDGDGDADFLDTDSDNDGMNDIDESGLTLSGDDLDDDGIDDDVAASYTDPDGIVNNPTTVLDNETGDTTEVGYREVVVTVTITGPGSVVEGQTTTAYTVSLDQTVPAGNSVEVALSYTGVAADGTDFTGVTTVTIPANANSTTFTIASIDDPIAEGAESFVVTITGTTDTDDSFDVVEIGAANNVETTINDEATPGPEDRANVSISGPATVVEGATATYTVNVDSAPATNLEVDVVTGFVTTDAGDLTPVTTTVTILAGQTSTTFDVDTTDDILTEGNESFTASITGTNGGGFEAVVVDDANDSVETTILDNEDVPQFTINDVVVDEAVGSATFTVTLSTPSTQTVTVDYETTDGTAIQGADYTASTGTLTFDPGETTQTITVGILDDAIDEIAETYNVLLSDPTNAVITDGMGLGTINDQTGVDATPGTEDTATVSITGPANVQEGQTATYTVNVDITPVAALNIDVVTGFVTTDAGDLTPVTTTVTILAGQTSTTFDVDTIDDSIMDDGETFIASITGATGGGFENVAVEVPVQLGAISGTVFQDGNNDGILDAGEVGIAAVSVTLTGTDVFGNSVDITVLSDAAGNYSFDNLNAGDYTVTQAQPLGFEDGIDNGAANTVVGNDQISNITLGAGQSITGNTFAEQPIGGGTAGFPPNLPSFATFTNLSINDRLGSNQAPGPIYAGIPINANANPLTLESGRPVAGGYNADFGSSDAGSPVEVEQECGDVVPVDPCNSCGLPIPVEQYPAQQIMVDECGCGPVMSSEQFQSGEVISEGQLMEAPIERLDVPNAESIGAPLGLQKPSFLKRFSGWLSNADRG